MNEALRIERLKAAIEGECDGLAISDEQAAAILAHLDARAAPESPQSDIVSRLRDTSGGHINGLYDARAADEIERLRARVAALEAQAEPVAWEKWDVGAEYDRRLFHLGPGHTDPRTTEWIDTVRFRLLYPGPTLAAAPQQPPQEKP